jgi:hypothetical protein
VNGKVWTLIAADVQSHGVEDQSHWTGIGSSHVPRKRENGASAVERARRGTFAVDLRQDPGTIPIRARRFC